MMRSFLFLGVLLALCSSAMAAGNIELRVAPGDVNPSGYSYSDTITIQIYAPATSIRAVIHTATLLPFRFMPPAFTGMSHTTQSALLTLLR